MMDVRDGAGDRAECMGEWESHSGRSCRIENGSQISETDGVGSRDESHGKSARV